MMIRSRNGQTCLRSALATSRGRSLPCSSAFHASPRPLSQREGQLHFAAQVSSADADLSPPATPQSPLTWATPRPPVDEVEKTLLAEQSLQTAKERRLSPVGLASLWHVGGPATLPPNLREAMTEMVTGGDSKLLRSDVKMTLANDAEGPEMKKRSQRSRAALLHLATASPQRYATIHQVLKTTAQRLARPLPYALGEGCATQGWAPKRVVESGCAVGEGAWAAAEVWPELEQWSGNDSRPHLLAAAEDLLTFDAASSEPSVLSRLRKAQPSSVEFEANKSHGVRYQRPSSERKLDLNASEESTLSLSAYQLLSLSSDSAREQHVRSLWNSGAEAIVLIEEGTDRGFAAIASARALLLELGEEAKVEDVTPPTTSAEDDDGEAREKLVLGGVEFIEEKASDRVSTEELSVGEGITGRGCYVVAPCPHDRPCPLLHPFLLDLDHDTVTDVAKRSGPSNHHRASGVGLDSCLHPVRYLPPSWSRDLGSEDRRRKREKGGREERSARMAYVVVKRGERPTMDSLRQEGSEAAQSVEAAVPYARRGPIEEVRRGDSLPRRLPEDVVDIEGGETDLQGDLSPSGELFKLLPPDLQQALSASREGENEAGEQQLPQDQDLLERAAAAALQGHKTNTDGADVWAASAEAADSAKAEQAEIEEAEATTGAEHNEDWLSALLATNEARPEDLDASTSGHPEPSASDVASAVSLLVPSLPRIVMPPIKKGGHVTFDACHSNGSIQRYTISKAAGKQTYHEVRKSSWADLWSQDPVEMAAPSRRVKGGEASEALEEEEEADEDEDEDGEDDLSLLETRDEATGRRKWIKRRGWGQWSRVAPADPSAGLAMDGTGTPFRSSSSSSPRSTRASDRPSAYIGADQICPLTSSGEVKGSKNKKKSSALSAATTSAAAGQRGARSRKGAKAYAGARDKESKRKRSMNSYHEEVAEGFDALSI
ncbi:hypothetical protein BCV69DRAFT_279890 [Microstroma glucosiphilum]|uniref:Rsm22-domain-containing protein n=1 Tax=Pseudomicrostroma glucosiphilum TaxID=1684307 RepID=A0A316UJ65_9BASI|nr:hypothetical protein BCV69DRAFT_279890 [Pseudomicrostroma glucosiphilum]PWN23983.1 hypothetical protein BCV69DRAFT_279890 [Pseudomicrostroma glucosiphilum]